MPTQSAWPDCFGLRGGPRGKLGIGAVSAEPRLAYRAAIESVEESKTSDNEMLPGSVGMPGIMNAACGPKRGSMGENCVGLRPYPYGSTVEYGI